MTDHETHKNLRSVLLIAGIIIFFFVIVFFQGNQPSIVPTPADDPIVNQNSQANLQVDVSALTQQTLNKILQKIKSAPNAICGNLPCIKLTYDSGTADITMIYELSADPLEPGSTDALVLEIETNIYMDENGKRLTQSEVIQEVFMFRDTDLDLMPNDYWSNNFEQNVDFLVITNKTPDVSNLLKLWAVGINYFNQVLLK